MGKQVHEQSTTLPRPLSAGILKRCFVYALATLAIGCLVTITLAGSDALVDDNVGSIKHNPIYYHGWPWRFAIRICPSDSHWIARRFAVWIDDPSIWIWPLVGDASVLLVGSAIVLVVSGRALRRRWQFTLRKAALGLTFGCAALGYLAYHQHLRWKEEQVVEQLQQSEQHSLFVDCWVREEYCGPRWLLQLGGDPRWFRPMMYHYTTAVINRSTLDTGLLLGELPRLRQIHLSVEEDKEVCDLLRGRPEWAIETITTHETSLTDGALPEIHRCPRLKQLDIFSTNIGDQGVSYAASCCPRLEKVVVSEFTDAGIRSLQQCPYLKVVIVGDSRHITDQGLKDLAALRRLEQLQLGNATFSLGNLELLRDLRGVKSLAVWPSETLSREEQDRFRKLVDEIANELTSRN